MNLMQKALTRHDQAHAFIDLIYQRIIQLKYRAFHNVLRDYKNVL